MSDRGELEEAAEIRQAELEDTRYAEFQRGIGFAHDVVWEAIEETKAAMENAELEPHGGTIAKLTMELFIAVWRNRAPTES